MPLVVKVLEVLERVAWAVQIGSVTRHPEVTNLCPQLVLSTNVPRLWGPDVNSLPSYRYVTSASKKGFCWTILSILTRAMPSTSNANSPVPRPSTPDILAAVAYPNRSCFEADAGSLYMSDWTSLLSLSVMRLWPVLLSSGDASGTDATWILSDFWLGDLPAAFAYVSDNSAGISGRSFPTGIRSMMPGRRTVSKARGMSGKVVFIMAMMANRDARKAWRTRWYWITR